MSDAGNKEIFASNLRRYTELTNKERAEICKELKIKYSTFSDWLNGNRYPKIDRIETLAKYFGIKKSDLIENKSIITKDDEELDALSEAERILVLHFRQVPDDMQDSLLALVQSVAKRL